MCLCRTKVSPTSHLPPHPKNNHTDIRRQCCETFQVSSILQRAKHLATCQISCNVTTSSKCAIFDKLQEKIRSIASRPAQKVTAKVQSGACNVTTSSKCALFDKLQEKIRSIASRPAQKVTGKSSEQSIKSVSQPACACVGQKFPSPSPTPPSPPPQK